MNKLYAVCHSLQEEEIKHYCFKQCGQIIIGGLDFNGMAWCPCRTEECPYLDRQLSMGEVDLDWGKEELILRKLLPFIKPPPLGVEEQENEGCNG